MCVCLCFIKGELLTSGHVMLVHNVALIFFHCDCCIDEDCIIIFILAYVLVYLDVVVFMEPHSCTDFELAFYVCGLFYLTRIGR